MTLVIRGHFNWNCEIFHPIYTFLILNVIKTPLISLWA
jgi:hypothetical protein